MAEFGAHVTSKAELSRASIFELLAQDNLSAGLRSAFHYIVNVMESKVKNRRHGLIDSHTADPRGSQSR